ncbi:MAG: dihydroorotate dehydrogenase [Burkholderiales bacterium]|nr:dihydroorotate dehydrogenase [Burkholderiales bacterium]
MVELSVRIGSLTLRNPVMPASGCFSHEFGQVFDLDRLGALVTKSVTPKLRKGNAIPRVAEVSHGMLNSIGIPSKGIAHFVREVVPLYASYSSPLVASVSADTVAEFADAAAALSVPGVAAIEANISCPNLEADGRAFAMMPDTTHAAVAAIRQRTALPVWAKLTPNTGDIKAVAIAAERAGADAVVVANTILGMSINVTTFRPTLGNVMGGLSGPAIKPIALRLVFQCAEVVSIPVIGCGGISTGEDVVEFMLAGATAVQVGTASFIHADAMVRIVDELRAFCATRGVDRVADLVHKARVEHEPIEW